MLTNMFKITTVIASKTKKKAQYFYLHFIRTTRESKLCSWIIMHMKFH